MSKVTSFICEHTAEYILVPKLKEILHKRFDIVTPIYPWALREGSNISKELHKHDKFKVAGLYPRRPKLVSATNPEITVKINKQILLGAQSGMNGKGLGLGLTAIPPTPLNSHPEKPFTPTSHGSLYYRILWDSTNVTEAIQIARNYNLEELHYQILVADASGDAVIISPGSGGELAFTRKEPAEDYLVASTSNCAIPESYIGGDSFKRYDTAVSALENLENGTDSIIDQCSSILESVHRQSSVQLGAYTAYSSIFDLKSRVAYVYYLSQFDEVIELNMDEELNKGQHYYRLSDLVSVQTNDQALDQYRAAQTRGWLVISGISIGILILLVGLIYLIYVKVKKRRRQTT